MATVLIAAGISAIAVIVAAVLAARAASEDLVVKRQLESTDRFLDLVSILENRTGAGDVGLNKQIATAWLLAQVGRDNEFLRRTAEETLKVYVDHYKEEEIPSLNAALRDALTWLEKPRQKIGRRSC